MTRFQHGLAFSLVALLLAGWTTAADAPPSAADIRQLYSDGKYNDVIKSVMKLTTSREWQAKKPDAFELYSLKGESHLHLKESALASASFDTAAKAASDQAIIDKAALDKAALIAAKAGGNDSTPTDEVAKYNTDRLNVGVARAMVYLIKHSTGTNYIPKATANQHVAGGSPEDHVKLDIVNADTRKQALTAVWTDQKNALTETITAATDTDNKSARPIMDAAASLAALRDFDFAANGNDDDTRKIAGQIADHARDLIQTTLDKMNVRLDVISTDALHIETQRNQLPGGGYSDRYRHHGLEGMQQGELKTMVANAQDIAKALKLLSDELNTEQDYFSKPTKDVKRVKDGADKLLKMDWAETYASMEAARKS